MHKLRVEAINVLPIHILFGQLHEDWLSEENYGGKYCNGQLCKFSNGTKIRGNLSAFYLRVASRAFAWGGVQVGRENYFRPKLSLHTREPSTLLWLLEPKIRTKIIGKIKLHDSAGFNNLQQRIDVQIWASKDS